MKDFRFQKIDNNNNNLYTRKLYFSQTNTRVSGKRETIYQSNDINVGKKDTSNRIVKNGNSYRITTETETQETSTSNRITVPKQVTIQKMAMSMQTVISSPLMNFMMKEVMKINTILE